MRVSLAVRGLRAGYHGFDVLHGVDLEVAAGSLTAMVGSNGAGKTTLLKAMVGLLPRRGEVILDGEALPPLASGVVRRGVVLVAEGRQLFPQMTVQENLELGGYLQPRAARGSQLEEVLRRFPRLRERARQAAGTLSGGEQQMLAIGRALMSRPRIMLLDEPSLGLAPRMIEELLALTLELREDGLTVLLVEQNVRKALSIADHAYVLERGRLVAQGAGRELLDSDLVREAYLGAHARHGAGA